jgi:hypothetical protein
VRPAILELLTCECGTIYETERCPLRTATSTSPRRDKSLRDVTGLDSQIAAVGVSTIDGEKAVNLRRSREYEEVGSGFELDGFVGLQRGNGRLCPGTGRWSP